MVYLPHNGDKPFFAKMDHPTSPYRTRLTFAAVPKLHVDFATAASASEIMQNQCLERSVRGNPLLLFCNVLPQNAWQ
jgi:hypothetical protein